MLKRFRDCDKLSVLCILAEGKWAWTIFTFIYIYIPRRDDRTVRKAHLAFWQDLAPNRSMRWRWNLRCPHTGCCKYKRKKWARKMEWKMSSINIWREIYQCRKWQKPWFTICTSPSLRSSNKRAAHISLKEKSRRFVWKKVGAISSLKWLKFSLVCFQWNHSIFWLCVKKNTFSHN